MTGLNHSLTGAVIGKLLPLPVAIPIAFASHFALDALPHFGEVFEDRKGLSKTIWTIDISLTVLFLGWLMINGSWSAVFCAVAAMSPDFAWIYRFTVSERFGKLPPKPENKFNSWHVRIQKFEGRPGIFFEIFWLVGVALLFKFLQ